MALGLRQVVAPLIATLTVIFDLRLDYSLPEGPAFERQSGEIIRAARPVSFRHAIYPSDFRSPALGPVCIAKLEVAYSYACGKRFL